MPWQDAINGLLFEGGSAVLLWLNVRRLLADGHVAGVDWRVTAFFALWGVWNVYYYAHLGQVASAAAALLVAGANGAWVMLALRLGRVPAR
ncbi:MAG: hypothetical protein AB7Q81_24285 [Gammaproteobacteria bacterium]